MLGQVAFHSFIVVVLSGVFLMFFYEPSTEQVTYNGSYVPLQGIQMSRALESTLDISFEVRAGLLMRQVHHWASLLMLAAIMSHLLRLFFTGGFRKPRELTWVVAFLLLVVMLAAALTGSSLPDDMASGTSLAVLDGVLKAAPIVGTWLSSVLFGGLFPGDVIALFYPLHVVILPAVLLLLFTVNAILALVHKPAQFTGPGRTNDNVVGRPLPVFAAKSGGFFFIVSGVVVLIAATVTINPVWIYGPADPSSASAGAGPGWYLAFLDGALRLAPGWEFVWLGKTWTLAVLIPVIVSTLFLVIVAVYPLVERWITGDRRDHHLLGRPRNHPARTGIGVAGVIFFGVLWAAAGSDKIATQFHLSIEGVLHGFQALIILGPIAGTFITRRICLGLQRKDSEMVLHGYETGRIVRSPRGGYTEVHQPLDAWERWRLVSFEEQAPLSLPPDTGGRITFIQRMRVRLSRFFFEDRIAPLTGSALMDDRPDADPQIGQSSGRGHEESSRR